MSRWICGCFRFLNYWTHDQLPTANGNGQDEQTVELDTSTMGTEVVIVKNGKRICGTGGAISNAPIVQNKAYFEAKVQASGSWGVGLARERCNLDRVPLGAAPDSWVLRGDSKVYNNNEVKATLSPPIQEGDVIGVTYDHVQLSFYVNGGGEARAQVTGIKGTVYALVYVDDSATLDVQFSQFYHSPPEGFDKILVEKSLL